MYTQQITLFIYRRCWHKTGEGLIQPSIHKGAAILCLPYLLILLLWNFSNPQQQQHKPSRNTLLALFPPRPARNSTVNCQGRSAAASSTSHLRLLLLPIPLSKHSHSVPSCCSMRAPDLDNPRPPVGLNTCMFHRLLCVWGSLCSGTNSKMKQRVKEAANGRDQTGSPTFLYSKSSGSENFFIVISIFLRRLVIK